MRLTFCGVRGSTPAPGAAFVRYGGQTSCVAIAPDGQPPRLLLDAGTGMQVVTDLLDGEPYVGSVLVGHLHWDHTQGMPFFGAGFLDGHRVDVLIPEQGEPAGAVMERSFSPPHFPITPGELGAGWSFTGLEEGAHAVEGFDVLAREIPHRGGRTFGFRVSDGGASVAYLSDHSPTSVGPGPDGLGARHEAILALVTGVDVMIHDAQHTADQFPGAGFLGHASPEYAVEVAREAGVHTLALFHHAPTRTDDEVDEILADALRRAGDDLTVLAARDGLALDLPSSADPASHPG